MTVQQRENQTVVLAPFVGSPAYKAGIRPGDIILKVDGKTCEGLTTTEVADLLKGAKGTVYTFRWAAKAGTSPSKSP